MNIYDVIRKWGLDKNPLDLGRYTRSQISLLATDIENCYPSLSAPSLGRHHQSLHTATAIVEASRPVESLAVPLLYSKQIVLPDPLYSLLSRRASSAWSRLPESGNASFTGTKSIYIQWDTYWTKKIEGRVRYLNERIPALVSRLLSIEGLVSRGDILLQPWEKIVDAEIPKLKAAISELNKNEKVIREITQKYPQDRYHLGIRLGVIGMSVSEDNSSLGLKKGEPMWFGDKTGVLLMGLIHSLLAQRLSSNFVETLPGDRVVFDYVRSGGNLNPNQLTLVQSLQIPNLSGALWDDIVAIRKDSELSSRLQDILSELSFVDSSGQAEVLIQELSELEARLAEDTSLRKYIRLPALEMGVGTIVGMASNAVTGAALPVALGAGALSAAGMFLYELATSYHSKDSAEKRQRRDLVVRLNHRVGAK